MRALCLLTAAAIAARAAESSQNGSQSIPDEEPRRSALALQSRTCQAGPDDSALTQSLFDLVRVLPHPGEAILWEQIQVEKNVLNITKKSKHPRPELPREMFARFLELNWSTIII